MGNRIVSVTQYVSTTSLIGNVLQQHQATIPDDPFLTPIPMQSGTWSIAAPIQTLYGLNHLEGMQVSVLADGIVQNTLTVSGGSITLQKPATAIIVGLGFIAQLQTMYLDIPGGVTVQGRRKEIDQVIARVYNSGMPFQVGVNQPDASTQPNQTTVPWTNMTGVQGPVEGSRTPIQPYDFNTGDMWTNVFDQLGVTNGQVAIQQSLPIPCNVLALMPWSRVFDDADA
jgi:hypothetical protein